MIYWLLIRLIIQGIFGFNKLILGKILEYLTSSIVLKGPKVKVVSPVCSSLKLLCAADMKVVAGESTRAVSMSSLKITSGNPPS